MGAPAAAGLVGPALDVTRGVLDLDDVAMEAIAARVRDQIGRG